MIPIGARLPACLAAVAILWSENGHAQVDVNAVMLRAATYAEQFFDRLSSAVTEERFEQTVTAGPRGSQMVRIRSLRSDLVFIRTGGTLEWTELRSVFEVDGRVVRDRESRLRTLFGGSQAARDEGTRIAEESARYNVGPRARTTNTPALALLFLQHRVQPRFTFTLGPRDRSQGERTWIVNYKERTRPTIVRGDNDADLPMAGRFSIDVDTGRVMRTVIETSVLDTSWSLTTLFKLDDRLNVAVPFEMRERFQVADVTNVGTATYGQFRIFSVSTQETIGPPAGAPLPR